MFLIYYVTSCDRVFKGLCDLIGSSHHLTKFCGHRPYGNYGAAVKIVYMALQEIKESGDFMEGNSSFYNSTLSKSRAIDIVLMICN